MSAATKDRATLRADLRLYRLLVAYQKREVARLEGLAGAHAARALAAELAGDDAQATYHYAMSRRLYSDMNNMYELRAMNLTVIRSLEKSVTA